jgi:hypothetical protein
VIQLCHSLPYMWARLLRVVHSCADVRCRLQLVYAWGSPMALPARLERVVAAQAVLTAMSALTDEGYGLLGSSVAVWQAAPLRYRGLWYPVISGDRACKRLMVSWVIC